MRGSTLEPKAPRPFLIKNHGKAALATQLSACSNAVSVDLSKEQLLGEIEDLIRTMPSRATIRHDDKPENLAWFGNVLAIIEKWNPAKSDLARGYYEKFFDRTIGGHAAGAGLINLITLLHQARNDLRIDTLGPVNTAIDHGSVFDYFDGVRRIIEVARQDLLFVDPYLDAEFVSRYLPQVAPAVTIRLLTRERLGSLLPAVDVFSQQEGRKVEVRSAPNFHDRYVFVDRAACLLSVMRVLQRRSEESTNHNHPNHRRLRRSSLDVRGFVALRPIRALNLLPGCFRLYTIVRATNPPNEAWR